MIHYGQCNNGVVKCSLLHLNLIFLDFLLFEFMSFNFIVCNFFSFPFYALQKSKYAYTMYMFVYPGVGNQIVNL